jgi:hypothetical protein
MREERLDHGLDTVPNARLRLWRLPAGGQFDLNVVRVAQDDERTPAVSLNVLNTRVRHPQGIKAIGPRFKSGEIAHTKRHMVKPDPPSKAEAMPSECVTAVTPRPQGCTIVHPR